MGTTSRPCVTHRLEPPGAHLRPRADITEQEAVVKEVAVVREAAAAPEEAVAQGEAAVKAELLQPKCRQWRLEVSKRTK
jgi:hypothetical protein